MAKGNPKDGGGAKLQEPLYLVAWRDLAKSAGTPPQTFRLAGGGAAIRKAAEGRPNWMPRSSGRE